MFDDDDVLGGMGLDSPGRGAMTSTPKEADDTAPRKGGARSIMSDLLGTDGAAKHREPPAAKSEPKEFVLDKRYVKSPAGGRQRRAGRRRTNRSIG